MSASPLSVAAAPACAAPAAPAALVAAAAALAAPSHLVPLLIKLSRNCAHVSPRQSHRPSHVRAHTHTHTHTTSAYLLASGTHLPQKERGTQGVPELPWSAAWPWQRWWAMSSVRLTLLLLMLGQRRQRRQLQQPHAHAPRLRAGRVPGPAALASPPRGPPWPPPPLHAFAPKDHCLVRSKEREREMGACASVCIPARRPPARLRRCAPVAVPRPPRPTVHIQWPDKTARVGGGRTWSAASRACFSVSANAISARASYTAPHHVLVPTRSRCPWQVRTRSAGSPVAAAWV
jgi:hypothetical protein